MPGTTLAATALSLVAALAACTNSDRPQPTEPAAADQQTTSAPSPAPTSTSTRPLTYTDDYVGHRRWSPRWLIQSIRYGDHTLRPGIDVMHMDLTDDGLALVAKNGGIYFADGSSVEKIGNSNIDEGFSWSAEGVKSASCRLAARVVRTNPSGPVPGRLRHPGTSNPRGGTDPRLRPTRTVGSQPWSAIVSTGPHPIPIPSAREFNFVPGAP